MAKEKPKMLTPKQYAERVEAAYSTVMSWLQRDLIPGAQKQELPSGGWYYVVPEDAPKPDLKPGPRAFVERLRAIAEEMLEEFGNQYAEFIIHPQAQDSNDWNLTYTNYDGGENRVHITRSASQTDDEVKEQIREQLATADDQKPTKPRRKAVKKDAKKRGARAK
jgi:hypothetical protein